MKQSFFLYESSVKVSKFYFIFLQFILSQEDLTTIFKTLYGNIWYEEGDSASPVGVKDQHTVASGVSSSHSGGMFLTLG